MYYKFDKRIFRLCLVASILLLFGGWALDDFPTKNYIYVYCPAGGGACNNPLYQGTIDWVPSYTPNFSGSDIAEMEQLPPGFTYGKQPNIIIKFATLWVVLLVFISFVINHFANNKNWKISKKDLKETFQELQK